MRSFRAWGSLLALLFIGCSENLGPPPPDGSTRVDVRSEGPAGPRIARAGTSVAATDGRVWVGTDAGLLVADTERPGRPWIPLHAGFFGSEGTEVPGAVEALAVDAGRVIFSGRRGLSSTLGVSENGGAIFVGIERPDVLVGAVDAVGVVPVSTPWPAGAWIVAQGRRLFVSPVGASRDPQFGTVNWTALELPGTVLGIDAVTGTDDGQLVAAARVGTDSCAVFVAAPGEDFLRRVTRPGSEVLALAVRGDVLAWATDAGIHEDDRTTVTWSRSITHAAFAGADAWAAVAATDTPGGALVARGNRPDVVVDADAIELPDGVEALAETGAVAWAVDGAAAITRVGVEVERTPFAGTAAGISALAAVDPLEGSIALARQRNGEVFVGPADDSDAYVSRSAQSTATVRAMVVDPAAPGTVVAASFGVYENAPDRQQWVDRSLGFQPYEIFLGDRFGVIALEVLADGSLWSGGENGEGPYRWRFGVRRWERVHDGLGTPGSVDFGTFEVGLPFVSQVRDFALDTTGRVWMAGFRGGVWRLDEASTPSRWVAENVGLPDLAGAAMDTCCVTGPERQVDARAVERVAGGEVLVATAWGIHARGPDDEIWQDRSLGLTNRDVRALAVSPRDPSLVVAIARGAAVAPDWLFLTEDAGRTWFPVGTSRVAVPAVDVVWSRPDRREVVVLVEGRGAWRLELEP